MGCGASSVKSHAYAAPPDSKPQPKRSPSPAAPPPAAHKESPKEAAKQNGKKSPSRADPNNIDPFGDADVDFDDEEMFVDEEDEPDADQPEKESKSPATRRAMFSEEVSPGFSQSFNKQRRGSGRNAAAPAPRTKSFRFRKELEDEVGGHDEAFEAVAAHVDAKALRRSVDVLSMPADSQASAPEALNGGGHSGGGLPGDPLHRSANPPAGTGYRMPARAQPLSQRPRALSMPELCYYGWPEERRAEEAAKADGPHAMKETDLDKGRDARGNKYVNQYLIIHKIGQTAWSKVKLCINTADYSPYVIKEVRKSNLCGIVAGGDGEAQIRREVALVKKLDHPNVVRFFEVIRDPLGDKLYFVMEYLAKGPIQSTDSQSGLKPVAPELVWMYFRDVVAGLDYLHAHGVVHGDIKPENMLVSISGIAKITDFGVSHELRVQPAAFPAHAPSPPLSPPSPAHPPAPATSSRQAIADVPAKNAGSGRRPSGMGQVSGSPVFLAPEVFDDGAGPTGARSMAVDVWALGISLYMMLAGRSPFQGSTLLTLSEEVRTADLVFPPKVSGGGTMYSPFTGRLRDLLGRMLDRDPNTRIAAKKLLSDSWVSRDTYHTPTDVHQPSFSAAFLAGGAERNASCCAAGDPQQHARHACFRCEAGFAGGERRRRLEGFD